MAADPQFLFVVCQCGAEKALKEEVGRRWPSFRLAYSRPGFVTFKLPAGFHPGADFDLGGTLTRQSGFCLGKVSAAEAEAAAREVWQRVGSLPVEQVHVWQRDTALPGDRGFEPGISPLATEIAQILTQSAPRNREFVPNRVARAGERILDCILVEPQEWWIGWHVATHPATRWPGGVPHIDPPEFMISRAYLKIREALAWSQLPVRSGDVCAEIGSAPGGSVQALLEKGLWVIGIDPAEMDEEIAGHPHFRHLRKRAMQVRRREFRRVKWLFADANVAPRFTLDAVEPIVTFPEVAIRGMLLTLKLSQWSGLDAIPELCERVRSWGFPTVRTRQLAYNRREFCLAARRDGN